MNLGGEAEQEEVVAEPQPTFEGTHKTLLILAGVSAAALSAAAYVFQKKEEEL